MEQGKHVMCVADVKICSIDWDSFPFTDLTFHVADCFSISSLQCDCGLLRRLTLIWVIFRHSRVQESTNPQVHRLAHPRIYESRLHESTNHSLCFQQCLLHFAHHAQGRTGPVGCCICQYLGLEAITRIHKPTTHEFTNPRVYISTSPRIHESIVLFGCASHSTLYAADRILHTVPEKMRKNWHCALLCQC